MQTLTHNIMKQPEAITSNGCGSTEAYPTDAKVYFD